MSRIELMKMIFGFALLALLIMLAACIALGKVEEKTSYGLTPLLIMLTTLSDRFAQWAFAPKRTTKDDEETK